MLDCECWIFEENPDELLTRTRSFAFLPEQLTLNWIEAEDFTHAGEAAAMNWRGAELLQETAVLRRGIAFVCGEVIAGMHGIKLSHQGIARRLGDDRGRRDARGKRVAFDDAALWRGAIRDAAGVYQNEVGFRCRALYSASHREETGLVDIEGVDFFHFAAARAPHYCVLFYLLGLFIVHRRLAALHRAI